MVGVKFSNGGVMIISEVLQVFKVIRRPLVIKKNSSDMIGSGVGFRGRILARLHLLLMELKLGIYFILFILPLIKDHGYFC